MAAEVRHLLEQRGAQALDHGGHQALLLLKLHHAGQEAREVPAARHRRAHPRRMRHRAWRSLRACAKLRQGRAPERQRLEPAKLQKRRVAAQLPQQRPDRGVLEHDARDRRAPHRAYRVVVAPAAPSRLERCHDLLVGKGGEHQPQPLKVRQAFDTVPRKGWLLRCRHHVLPTGAGGWNEGRRPDGDTFYPIRPGQRDALRKAPTGQGRAIAGRGVKIADPASSPTPGPQKSATPLG